jgi:hypothetical protein
MLLKLFGPKIARIDSYFGKAIPEKKKFNSNSKYIKIMKRKRPIAVIIFFGVPTTQQICNKRACKLFHTITVFNERCVCAMPRAVFAYHVDARALTVVRRLTQCFTRVILTFLVTSFNWFFRWSIQIFDKHLCRIQERTQEFFLWRAGSKCLFYLFSNYNYSLTHYQQITDNILQYDLYIIGILYNL